MSSHHAKNPQPRKSKLLTAAIAFTTSAIVVALIWIFRIELTDQLSAWGFEPTAATAEVRANLNLTSSADLIYRATHTSVADREVFAASCPRQSDSTAVLGCYTDDKIFVFDVRHEELSGIREVTLAHELLHAVYARLSDSDRNRLKTSLMASYEAHRADLDDNLSNYDESQLLDELHSRLATEVSDLPDDLESHYAHFFNDRQAIVSLFNQYNGFLTKLRAHLSDLEQQIAELATAINTQTSEYQSGAATLSRKIDEFNSCADTTGCFSSQSAFNSARSALVAEQQRLDALYDVLTAKINQHNSLVEEYNSAAITLRSLNDAMVAAPPASEL
jgi:hypothetical protein